MKETNHPYACLSGNFYDLKTNHVFHSWKEFKDNWLGFNKKTDGTFGKYDDDYHFLFRYDIKKYDNNLYYLQLCHMLQRKGIYCFHCIYNIDQKLLDTEIKEWLLERKEYILKLWDIQESD